MKRELRRSVRAILVLALLGPGCDFMCGKKKPAATADAGADETPAGVEVMSAGAEPRVKLEIGRWAGLHYELETESDGSFGKSGEAPAKAPTSVLKLSVEVQRGTADPLVLEKDGRKLRLVEERATLERIEIRNPAAPADFMAKLNAAFGLLRGLTTRSLIAESGELVEVTTEHVGGVVPPPEIKQILDEALSGQRFFPFRLPPTPVGLGARWRFSAPLEARGVKSLQVADLTLVELGAKTARIGVRVRHQAPRQEVPHPTEPGLTATLVNLRGDADGEVTIDRLTACILAARFSSTSHLTMTWMDADGHDQTATFLQANVQRMRGRVGPPDDAGTDGGEARVDAEPEAAAVEPADDDEDE